jgi:hypothetical protein
MRCFAVLHVRPDSFKLQPAPTATALWKLQIELLDSTTGFFLK